MNQEVVVEDQTLVIRRTFAAPIDLVYQAWTDPDRMVRWLSPNVRWKSPLLDIESRVGGRHNVTMRHSDGDMVPVVGEYREIVPNERISFTWVGAEWIGLKPEDIPEPSLVTIEFRTVPEGTELTLTHDRRSDPTPLEDFKSGWTGCFEMLERYLDGKPTFIIE